MLVRRRHRRTPLLTYVVDPFSPEARAWVPAVRELALRVGDEMGFEVVCTGDEGAKGERSRLAAAGLIALLATDGVHPLTLVEDVLRAHTDDGRDITDPDVIAALATARHLDGAAVRVLAASPEARQLAVEDRELARGLGDPRGAALRYTVRRRIHPLPGPGSSGRELVEAWSELTGGRRSTPQASGPGPAAAN